MKQFRHFILKEIVHVLRDRRTLFILLGMPIAQILIFGFALTNEVKNSYIAILDQANDEASLQIRQRLEASRYFEIKESLRSEKEVHDAFNTGKINLIVVFPPNFNSDLQHLHHAKIQLIADASDPNKATTLTQYASAIISDYQREIAPPLPITIHTQARMLYNPQLKSAYNFVPGVMAMVLMLVCAMMTSIAIVREKEMGTMEVILVSPIRPMRFIFAKMIPYFIVSIVNIASLLLLSVYVLDVAVQGNLFLLIAISLLFALCTLSLGLLISVLVDTQQIAMFASLMVLFLPTILLSGFMFPIENMPLPLQFLSNFMPAKWYFYIVRDIMIKGVSFSDVWIETGILVAMTAFLLFLSLKKFNVRLE